MNRLFVGKQRAVSPISGRVGVSPRMLPEGGRVGPLSPLRLFPANRRHGRAAERKAQTM